MLHIFNRAGVSKGYELNWKYVTSQDGKSEVTFFKIQYFEFEKRDTFKNGIFSKSKKFEF